MFLHFTTLLDVYECLHARTYSYICLVARIINVFINIMPKSADKDLSKYFLMHACVLTYAFIVFSSSAFFRWFFVVAFMREYGKESSFSSRAATRTEFCGTRIKIGIICVYASIQLALHSFVSFHYAAQTECLQILTIHLMSFSGTEGKDNWSKMRMRKKKNKTFDFKSFSCFARAFKQQMDWKKEMEWRIF